TLRELSLSGTVVSGTRRPPGLPGRGNETVLHGPRGAATLRRQSKSVTHEPEKTALRVRLRGLRRRLAIEVPDAAERAVRRLPLSRFSRFRIVSAYRPQGSELDPMPLLQAILDIKPGFAQAALPVAVDRDAPLRFRLWRPEDPLAPDAVGVPSPAP